MSFRQIKSPALADRSIISTKLDSSAVTGQTLLTGMANPADCFTLLYDVGSDSLKKISTAAFFGSFDTDDLAEGSQQYFTPQRAQDAVAADIASAVAVETARALAAEGVNATSIVTETNRATAAEVANATAVSTEANRATVRENAIESAYQTADAALSVRIDNILTNTDSDALNSLAEIVVAFQGADSVLTASTIANSSAISGEVARATAAETANATAISGEVTRATGVEAGLQSSITSEAATRLAADNALDARLTVAESDVSSLETDLAAEVSRAGQAELVNASGLAAEIVRATGAEAANATNLEAEITARAAADTSVRVDMTSLITTGDAATLVSAKENDDLLIGDASVDGSSGNTVTDRVSSAVAVETTRAQGQESAIRSEFALADSDLQSGLDSEIARATAAEGVNASAISTETSRATGEESRIEAKLDNVISNTDAAALDSLTEIVAAFVSADSDMSALIASNTIAINAEAGARASADSLLQTNITTEASTRSGADTTLQSNITAEATARIAGDAATLVSAQTDATSKADAAEAAAIVHADAQDTALIGDASVDGTVGNTLTARIATAKSQASTYTDTQVSAEAATRLAADNALSLRASTLEGSVSTLQGEMDTVEADILAETALRVSGDASVQAGLDSEVARATAAEGVNAAAILAETTRASAAEVANATAISNEVTRASGVESGLRTDVDANTVTGAANAASISVETTRALAAEAVNASGLAGEIARASAAEAVNATSIVTEAGLRAAGDVALRTDVDANADDIIGLDSDISAESVRAIAAEGVLTSSLASEVARATAAEGVNASAISAESTRASGVEAGLRTDVDANAVSISGVDSDLSVEIARATAAEGVNASGLAAEIVRATGIESGLRTDVNTVTGRVDAIIGTSPETLDTLQEIVAAFEGADSDIQNIINNNSGRLSSAESDIDAVEVRATDLESRATAVEGRATSLESEQSAQGGRLTVNEGDIDSLESKVGSGTLGTVAVNLSAAINEIHSELDVEAGKVSTLETEMDAVEVRSTAVEGRATALETEQGLQSGRLTVNEGDIDGLESKVGVATLGTTATNLSAAINEIHSELDVEAGKVSTLQGEMTAVEGQVSTLESEMNAVEAEQALQAGRLTVNEGDIDSLESKMGSGVFATTSQTVVGSSNELHGEINAIEARVDSAEADILSNAAAISTESSRALGQETAIRSEFAAADTAITSAYIAADAVVLSSASVDATTKANNAEAAAKIYADTIVGDEVVDRTNADAVLQSAIDAEETARLSADATLSSRATVLETEMSATQSGAGLAANGNYVAPSGTNFLDAAVTLKDADSKLDAALKAEETRALAAEGANTTSINTEIADRIAADSDLQVSLDAEVSRAVAAEGVLTSNVAINAASIVTESSSRQSADANLQTQIDFITSNTDAAALDSLTEIVASFQAADGTLTGLVSQNQTDIATNASGLAAELTARAAQGSAIRGEFAAADAGLQTQIDGKVAKSGDTMSGVLNMGSNVISGLADGSVDSDAVNKGQLDAGLAAQHISTKSTSDLAEGSNLYFTNARVHAAVSVTDVSGEGNVSVTDGVFSLDTAKAFVELTDVVDSTITGKEGFVARVKPDGSGIELVDPTQLAFNNAQRQTISGDGAQTTFALNFATLEANAMVFVGGVVQDPSVHYNIDSEAQTISFNAAIPVGTQAVVIAQSTNSVGVLDPKSVGIETLADNIKVFEQGNDIVVGTSATVVSSFNSANYRTAKYIVTVANGSEFETRECLVIHNGTDAFITEYGIVYTGAALLGDTDIRVVGSTVELLYTSVSAGSVVSVSATYVDA